jgi:hypothetical protein
MDLKGTGKPLGKCPLGRLRRRWENNIKMDVREVSCDKSMCRNWLEIVSSDWLLY